MYSAHLKSDQGALREVLGHLPGSQFFDVLQTVDSNGMPVEKQVPVESISKPAPGPAVNIGGKGGTSAAAMRPSSVPLSAGTVLETVLVVFIGGVTFAEISALRLLSSRPEWPYRFLVMTTKIVNGHTLLQTFMDPLVNEYSVSG